MPGKMILLCCLVIMIMRITKGENKPEDEITAVKVNSGITIDGLTFKIGRAHV